MSGTTPLPGVVVSARQEQGGHPADATSSAPDGTYVLQVPGPGQYAVRAELAAFAPFNHSITLDGGACDARMDVTLTLASRAAQVSGVEAAPESRPALQSRGLSGRGQAPAAPGARGFGRGNAGRGTAGRGGGSAATPFQSLELRADENGLARLDDVNGGDGSAQTVLPPGFSADASAESVTAVGTAQPNGFFGPNGPAQFIERFGGAFPDGQLGPGAVSGPVGFGGRGFGPAGAGGLGGAGGGGQIFIGPLGRGDSNRIRGSFFQSFDMSSLDSSPYALNGQPTTKPSYLQQRFGATIGGPLGIPKVVDSSRTFFFLNYTGNHSDNPYDAYSTVPTLAERSGDLSAVPHPITNPANGQPFAGNQIPASQINASSLALLGLIPTPNQAGDKKNFHTVTTNSSQLDDINVRVVHTFGEVPQPGQGGRGAGFGGRGGGGRGGPGGGRAGASNLNVAVHFRRSDTGVTNPFPSIGGASSLNALDIPASYTLTKAGILNTLRVDFNRQHTETTNLYANAQDVAGAAGIEGVSTSSFDWGAPNLSFSSLASLRDLTPASRIDRTMTIGDTITKVRDKHTTRFGGDYRDIRSDSRTDPNARGSFVFSGLYTASDFADFLLGLPQQASVQYGPGLERFRSKAWDLFIQDDWRVNDKLTINGGVRYEYFSPLTEASNRLVTLDVPANLATAVPVQVEAGGTGPYSGSLPDSLVRPFRGGVGPRVGVAWRPRQGWVVRTGYGINYSATTYYQSIAQQLASQPPFAVAATVLGSASTPLNLQTVLQSTPNGGTYNYAIDPNYRPGMVQIWNVDLQHDLSRTIQLGIGYTGTKGSSLDLLRAPNRGPDGLQVADVPAFIFESSGADSIRHALTLRLRKRLSHGFSFGGAYTLSRSVDDASSIGGGGSTVAQNDQDLAAERGLSTFDQRHRFAGNFIVELPFGDNKRWLQRGLAATLAGHWQVNGTVQLASGTPYTVRVLGATGDVAGGVNGTLRANYNGAPIALDNPTALEFFNTAAFSLPAPGTYGNSGRNVVIGPGTSVLNLGLMRDINLGGTRGLSLQVVASNVLNTVQYASIDTVINSPTFGQVTSARPMRRLMVLTRFRF